MLSSDADDGTREMPVPAGWRPALTEIADLLVDGDPRRARRVAYLEPVPEQVWSQCRDAVEDYGDVDVVPLPPATWETSVCRRWGEGWLCLVDLWTAQEGRCDLVLEVRVREETDGPRFTIGMVYVP
ncbi:hypothetical protein LG324_13605 [Phycicoccus jejuensis]|uniref:DUF7668 domain-containing protein n=1 Tax=Phycicoccus jejuensis TaxID=367299 RepID=UPI00384F1562